MKRVVLGWLDRLLHLTLDGYINRRLPGWGVLQHGQWHVCQACEEAKVRCY